MTAKMQNSLLGKGGIIVGYTTLLICSRAMAKRDRFAEFDVLFAVISFIQKRIYMTVVNPTKSQTPETRQKTLVLEYYGTELGCMRFLHFPGYKVCSI